MLNYKKIVKVEYLFGYDRGNINNPIWSEITSASWDALTQRAGNVMCRMVPYHKELYGIKEYKSLNLPIYNEYFVINFPSVQQGRSIRASNRMGLRNANLRLPTFNSQRSENINEPMVNYGSVDIENTGATRIRTSAGTATPRSTTNAMSTPRGNVDRTSRPATTTGAGNSSTY